MWQYPGALSASQISTAVILAAGRGLRLRGDGEQIPKPLRVVAGQTLIERVITTLAAAGITRAVTVVGHMADRLRDAVVTNPRLSELGVSLEFAQTLGSDKAHGASVLGVDGLVDEPFVLTMCDHVYDVSLARAAATADMSRSGLYLCVDRRLAEIYDMDDATKVRTDGDRIVDIGKQIAEFDAVDCGVFAAGQALLDALRDLWETTGDASLSEGVLRLAAVDQAHVIDIGAAFWQDVDTPGALARAESILRHGD